MSSIPEFTDSELWILRRALEERYGKQVEPEPAEAELRLDPNSSQLTPCPTAFWSERGAHFAVFKVGEGRYRCMFYYNLRMQYGTGVDEFTDLAECVVTLLQVQADDESKRAARQERAQT